MNGVKEESEERKRRNISKPTKVAPLRRENGRRDLRVKRGPSKPWYLFYPESSVRRTWDLVSMGLLVYTIFVTPFQIAFDVDEKPGDVVWVINRMVDLGFGIDLILNFLTVYIDAETKLPVTRVSLIALQYVKGWFWIDLISVLPLDSAATEFVPERDTNVLRSFKLVRVVRLVRLVKLLRVLRIARVVKRMQHRLGIRFGVVKILKFFFFVGLTTHWNACVWFMIADLSGEEDEDGIVLDSGTQTWIHVYFAEECSSRRSVPCPALWEGYFASLYWAVMTLTTIGYGDILPQTDAERILAMILMLIDASVFAFMVSSITTLVGTLNFRIQQFESKMDHLDGYMKAARLPEQLRFTLREYFTVAEKWTYKHNNEIFKNMTNRLQGQAMAWCYRDLICQVPAFEDTDDPFVAKIASMFRLVVYPPDEFIYAEGDAATHILFVNKGLVRMLDRHGLTVMRIRDGGYFGDDCLITSSRQLTAQSMSFSCLLLVHEDDFRETTRQYPAVMKRLRATGLRLVIKRLLKLPAAEQERLIFSHHLVLEKAQSSGLGASARRVAVRGGDEDGDDRVESVHRTPVDESSVSDGWEGAVDRAIASHADNALLVPRRDGDEWHGYDSMSRRTHGHGVTLASSSDVDGRPSRSKDTARLKTAPSTTRATKATRDIDEVDDDLIATIHAQDEQLEVLQGFWDQDIRSLRADIASLRGDLQNHMSSLTRILDDA